MLLFDSVARFVLFIQKLFSFKYFNFRHQSLGKVNLQFSKQSSKPLNVKFEIQFVSLNSSGKQDSPQLVKMLC